MQTSGLIMNHGEASEPDASRSQALLTCSVPCLRRQR